MSPITMGGHSVIAAVTVLIASAVGVPVVDQSTSTGVLSGALSDPAGDVRASAAMPTPPDLVSAHIDVRDGLLTLTVTFAPGTLSPRTTLNVYFDVDENPRTGRRVDPRSDDRVGADYELTSLQPHDPTRGALRHHLSATESKTAGLIEFASPAPDVRQVRLPLSRLGGDDGRMTFELECSHVLESTISGQRSTQTIVSHVDVMPNRAGRPGRVR